MATATISFTNSFSDGTKRTLSISPFANSALDPDEIRNAVKDLNADPSSISSFYLSKAGASFVEISQVKISIADKVIII